MKRLEGSWVISSVGAFVSTVCAIVGTNVERPTLSSAVKVKIHEPLFVQLPEPSLSETRTVYDLIVEVLVASVTVT